MSTADDNLVSSILGIPSFVTFKDCVVRHLRVNYCCSPGGNIAAALWKCII